MPFTLLAIEFAAIVAVWLAVRLRREQAVRRHVTCPLDGQPAVLLIVGGESSTVNVVSCSLQGGHLDERACNRACVDRVAAPA